MTTKQDDNDGLDDIDFTKIFELFAQDLDESRKVTLDEPKAQDAPDYEKVLEQMEGVRDFTLASATLAVDIRQKLSQGGFSDSVADALGAQTYLELIQGKAQ